MKIKELPKDELKSPKSISEPSFKKHGFWNQLFPVNFGLVAGLSMGIYLLLLSLAMEEPYGAIKYFQYLLLFVFLYLALSKNEKSRLSGRLFQNGIVTGSIVSIVSGIIYAVLVLGFSVFVPEYSLNKFGLEINSISRQLSTMVGMVLETFVFGMIITFVWLQYFKRSSSSQPINTEKPK